MLIQQTVNFAIIYAYFIAAHVHYVNKPVSLIIFTR